MSAPRSRGDVIEENLKALDGHLTKAFVRIAALEAKVEELRAAAKPPADWADEPAAPAEKPKSSRKSFSSSNDPAFRERVLKAYKAAVNANPAASDREIVNSLRGMGCDWLIRRTLREAGVFLRRIRVRTTPELKTRVLEAFAKLRNERPTATAWDIATDVSKENGMPSSTTIQRIVEEAGAA